MSKLAGNVLLYVPLGLLLVFAVRRITFTAVVAVAATVSLLLEIGQWAINTGRSASLDDVLLNVLGSVLGWLAATTAVRLSSGERGHVRSADA
jgi:glycopeptide antibiotics resistance protein